MQKLLLTLFISSIFLALLYPLRLQLIAIANEPVANGAAAFLGLSICLLAAFVLRQGEKADNSAPLSIDELKSFRAVSGQEKAASSAVKKKAQLSQSSKQRAKKICLVCSREFPEEFQGKCPDDKTELYRLSDYMAPGSIFSEYYQIIGPLGEGTLSKVFHAKHLKTNKNLAIKMLHSHLCQDSLSLQRFQREAKALSQLSHANLISVHDFMVSADGIPFIIMDYLEGETLQAILSRDKRLNWREAAGIFVQVCKGLAHAHGRGIIHRDLKPSNIMLVMDDKSGLTVKVLDFGLAKTSQADSIGRITQTGEVFGSPLYMSPEQCQGVEVDRRSDVYALGCIIYESLTGSPPFVGKDVMDTLNLHLDGKIPEFPPETALPPWMVQLTVKALQKDPDKRHQSIEDLGGLLQDGLRMQKS